MPLCSGVQPGASQCSIRCCCGLARWLARALRALVCMDRAMDALREKVRGRHVGRCRMSFVWVPSMSVALVGPHASMPDDVRLSDRMFCVCDLSTLAATYHRVTPQHVGFVTLLYEPLAARAYAPPSSKNDLSSSLGSICQPLLCDRMWLHRHRLLVIVLCA